MVKVLIEQLGYQPIKHHTTIDPTSRPLMTCYIVLTPNGWRRVYKTGAIYYIKYDTSFLQVYL